MTYAGSSYHASGIATAVEAHAPVANIRLLGIVIVPSLVSQRLGSTVALNHPHTGQPGTVP